MKRGVQVDGTTNDVLSWPPLQSEWGFYVDEWRRLLTGKSEFCTRCVTDWNPLLSNLDNDQDEYRAENSKMHTYIESRGQ